LPDGQKQTRGGRQADAYLEGSAAVERQHSAQRRWRLFDDLVREDELDGLGEDLVARRALRQVGVDLGSLRAGETPLGVSCQES
jgi:hypothetical protein